MESSQKKVISAYAMVLFGICLTAKVIAAPEYVPTSITEDRRIKEIPAEESEIICWYTGEENRAYFEACADDFEDKTGIVVNLQEQPSLNYFSEIYNAVKEDALAPDVYLLEADHLEQAYFSQLLEKNEYKESFVSGFAENAVEAASRENELYGYPLYFHVPVFAYRTDYFETAPKTVQEMIDYSVEHEPGEGVEKLLEWNLADGFYNYPFFGNAVEWTEEMGTLEWSYPEKKYEACKTFFGNLTAAIELEEETINSNQIVGDFVNGKTVAVFMDSDDIAKIDNTNVKIAKLPKLNEEIPMKPAAKTMLLCVNGMSDSKAAAAEFAAFVTLEKTEQLTELTGHVPVKENLLTTEAQKKAFSQYEKAELEPDALNATDFWVKFQNEVLEIWNDAE